MGMFFTLFYIMVAYLTPPVIFGPASIDFHIGIILAIPAIFCTIISFNESRVSRIGETPALFGLTVAVLISVVFYWLRQAPEALLDFLPNALAFFFVAVNFRTKKHLQMLTAVLLFISFFVIIQGYLGERSGIVDKTGGYFIVMSSDTGETFYRLRGLGVIEDPNDFAQFLLVTVCCTFFFWVKGKGARNLLLVYVPVGVLLYGVFLTHSRGAVLALAIMCMLAGRKKLGLIPSLVGGGVLVIGMMALGFTGGRDISAANGEDRMDAWSTGLQLLRTHPIFGVGYGRFTEYYPITAHNSVVVCAAELGMFGFFFWLLLVIYALRNMFLLSQSVTQPRQKKKKMRGDLLSGVPGNLSFAQIPAYAFSPAGSINDVQPAQAVEPASLPEAAISPYLLQFSPEKITTLSKEELQRLGSVMLLAFAAFLSTGWFLSRSFTMLFFITVGMSAVVFRMALDQDAKVQLLPYRRAMKLTILPAIALIIIVDIILRLDHLRR